MSPSRRTTGGWSLFALGLFVTWISQSRVLDVRGIQHPRGLAAFVDLSFFVTPIGALVATLVYVASLFAIVQGRHRLAGCASVGLWLGLSTHVAECQWPTDLGVAHATAMGGAAMVAYTIAHVLTRRRSPPERDRLALEAIAGVVAASYALAGASKLLGSGVRWAEGRNVALHIASHALASPSPLTPFRLAVATHPTAIGALGIGTLLIECGFVFFVVPRSRPVFALLSAAMHLSISLLMGLHHEEWMLMVLGVAVLTSTHEREAQLARATTATITTIHSGSK